MGKAVLANLETPRKDLKNGLRRPLQGVPAGIQNKSGMSVRSFIIIYLPCPALF